jgi:hypothetical protein
VLGKLNEIVTAWIQTVLRAKGGAPRRPFTFALPFFVVCRSGRRRGSCGCQGSKDIYVWIVSSGGEFFVPTPPLVSTTVIDTTLDLYLQVHGQDADIDTLCIGPRQVDLGDFFQTVDATLSLPHCL